MILKKKALTGQVPLFNLLNSKHFINKLLDRKRLCSDKLFVLNTSNTEEVDSVFIANWLEKINKRFTLKDYSVFKIGKHFVLFISCEKKVDTKTYSLFEIEKFDIQGVYLFTSDIHSVVELFKIIDGYCYTHSIFDKRCFIFNSLDFIKKYSFLRFLYESEVPTGKIKPVMEKITENSKLLFYGNLSNILSDKFRFFLPEDNKEESHLISFPSSKSTDMTLDDSVAIRSLTFSNKFRGVEKIISNSTLSDDQKQLKLEELSIGKITKSEKLKFTLNAEHFKMVSLIDSVLNTETPSYAPGVLLTSIYTLMAYEKTRFFYKPVFNLEDTLNEFMDDSKAFQKKHKTPVYDSQKNHLVYLLIFYFKEICKFIDLSIGLLTTRILVNIFLDSHNVEEGIINLKGDTLLYNAVSFSDKLMKPLLKCFSQGLNMELYKDKDKVDLHKLVNFMEKVRLSFLTKNTNVDKPVIKLLEKPFVLVDSQICIGDKPVYSYFVQNRDFKREFSNIINICLESLNIIKPQLTAIKTEKEYTTPYQYSFSSQILSFLTLGGQSSFETESWPLLIKPADWKSHPSCIFINDDLEYEKRLYYTKDVHLKNDSNLVVFNDLINGGYHYKPQNYGVNIVNSPNTASGIKIYSSRDYAQLGDASLSAINYLQSTPYCIDLDFLKYVEKNFIQCYLDFSKYKPEKPISQMFSFFNKDGEEITTFEYGASLRVKTMRDFVKNSKEILLLKEKDLSRCLNEVKVYVEKRVNYLTNQLRSLYLNEINTLFTFFNIFFTAFLYKNTTFYFSSFFDFRTRVYYLARLFSLQSSNFAKAFINIKSESKNSLNVDILKYNKLQLSAFLGDKQKNSSKGFMYLKMNLQKNEMATVFSMDVSASGFQIYGALTGCKKLLIDTNLFVEGEQPLSKKDFYGTVLATFKDDFKQTIVPYSVFQTEFFLIYEEKINEKGVIFSDSIHLLLENVLSNLIDLIEAPFFGDRKPIKDFLMPYLYSEGSLASIKHFVVWASENLEMSFLKVELSETYKKLEVPLELQISLKRLLFLVFSLIRCGILKTLEKLYPGLQSFKKYMESSFIENSDIPAKKGILLRSNPDSSSTYSFYSLISPKIVKFPRYSPALSKVVSVSLTYRSTSVNEIRTISFNKSKAKNSVVPNFIHFLDAEILALTVCTLKKQGIFVSTAHDCFYTEPQHYDAVRQSYFNAVREIFFEKDCLESFFKANKVVLSVADLKLLTLFSSNRQEIKTLIDAGILKISDFILTP